MAIITTVNELHTSKEAAAILDQPWSRVRWILSSRPVKAVRDDRGPCPARARRGHARPGQPHAARLDERRRVQPHRSTTADPASSTPRSGAGKALVAGSLRVAKGVKRPGADAVC